MSLKDNPFIFSALALLILLSTFPLFRRPHELPMQISGSSSQNVLADRATISFQISSQGSKQSKVADEVRETTDEILKLLRPLTVPPNRTSTSQKSHDTSPTEFLPPIATLSVNTFSSESFQRSSILGEKNQYTSSIAITAEFRSVSALNSSANRTPMPGLGFHHLSLVLPSLTKSPHIKITQLKWFISPDRLAVLQSETRQNATAEALLKINDYIAPMKLHYPIIRCLNFWERNNFRSYEHFVGGRHDREAIAKQADAAIMYGGEGNHDELDGISDYNHGYEIEREKAVFGLEPQSIELESKIEGNWVVIERGWIRTALGLFL
jgi:hypothetical protein